MQSFGQGDASRVMGQPWNSTWECFSGVWNHQANRLSLSSLIVVYHIQAVCEVSYRRRPTLPVV